MNKSKPNSTATTLVILFIAVGVGSIMCQALENIESNIWFARGAGVIVTIITGFLCRAVINKIRKKR